MSASDALSLDAIRRTAASRCEPLPFPGQISRGDVMEIVDARAPSVRRACEALLLEAAVTVELMNRRATSASPGWLFIDSLFDTVLSVVRSGAQLEALESKDFALLFAPFRDVEEELANFFRYTREVDVALLRQWLQGCQPVLASVQIDVSELAASLDYPRLPNFDHTRERAICNDRPIVLFGLTAVDRAMSVASRASLTPSCVLAPSTSGRSEHGGEAGRSCERSAGEDALMDLDKEPPNPTPDVAPPVPEVAPLGSELAQLSAPPVFPPKYYLFDPDIRQNECFRKAALDLARRNESRKGTLDMLNRLSWATARQDDFVFKGDQKCSACHGRDGDCRFGRDTYKPSGKAHYTCRACAASKKGCTPSPATIAALAEGMSDLPAGSGSRSARGHTVAKSGLTAYVAPSATSTSPAPRSSRKRAMPPPQSVPPAPRATRTSSPPAAAAPSTPAAAVTALPDVVASVATERSTSFPSPVLDASRRYFPPAMPPAPSPLSRDLQALDATDRIALEAFQTSLIRARADAAIAAGRIAMLEQQIDDLWALSATAPSKGKGRAK
ncbi:hypothetical protein PHLGIDRAFT_117754 [Phlebiopsis gigantea 11061_1 CR5-6]|uniref:Cytochrome c domain-containing protein n=1 Tax=Phlebiopsis gigantea (strain 11061_1 CR5-6) TaxID=745531 RepID=A0A0C3S908_PHLG1|nr:hypothetical protein PHLGIDRAFT_117754 [Phlebiopsis gigantea 11061_1 CR5-6]